MVRMQSRLPMVAHTIFDNESVTYDENEAVSSPVAARAKAS